jgi:hypothetical protein
MPKLSSPLCYLRLGVLGSLFLKGVLMAPDSTAPNKATYRSHLVYLTDKAPYQIRDNPGRVMKSLISFENQSSLFLWAAPNKALHRTAYRSISQRFCAHKNACNWG